jgi:hypothetical protein
MLHQIQAKLRSILHIIVQGEIGLCFLIFVGLHKISVELQDDISFVWLVGAYL